MAVKYVAPVKKTDALSLVCDGASHALDLGSYTPSASGLTHSHVYVNVSDFTPKDPAKAVRLRIFMRRAAWNGEPVDDTFFYDLYLTRDGYSTLDSRSFFEWADGGRALSWRYQVNGAVDVTLSTRFVKYAAIS